MEEEIVKNLDDPKQLEKLYREDKTAFKRAFTLIYPDNMEKPVAQFWNERLNFEHEGISWGMNKELIFTIFAVIIAALLAEIPYIAQIEHDYFYPRNFALIVFPLMAAYFLWVQKIQSKTIIASVSVIIIISAVYINFLPKNPESHTLILACIHLPLFLWTVLGFSFVSDNLKNYQRRLDFLRFNGDLIVMTTIILIAGAVLTGITIGLFSLIEINIEAFYLQHIVVCGLAASPLVGTYLVYTNPHLVNKVSPVIAKVFTPLVLVTLVVYLLAIIGTGKDPYNDRDFLIVFNLLLVGVLAIIFFSIAETSKNAATRIEIILLLALSLVTVIVNGIALSAILYRITAWGITPNRLAVLGSNILILTNILLVAFRLFKSIKNRNQIEYAERSIASFLPVYGLWAFFVAFFFPLLFKFI